MRLERNCYCFETLFARSLHNVFQYVSVGTMYTVEVPHGHNRGAEAGRHLFEFVKNLHAIRSDLNLEFQFHPVVR